MAQSLDSKTLAIVGLAVVIVGVIAGASLRGQASDATEAALTEKYGRVSLGVAAIPYVEGVWDARTSSTQISLRGRENKTLVVEFQTWPGISTPTADPVYQYLEQSFPAGSPEFAVWRNSRGYFVAHREMGQGKQEFRVFLPGTTILMIAYSSIPRQSDYRQLFRLVDQVTLVSSRMPSATPAREKLDSIPQLVPEK